MKQTDKLFLVTLKGFLASSCKHHYVVARGPTQAYETVRFNLEKRDYGFKSDRELERIDLLAEDAEYTDTGAHLSINYEGRDKP